MRKKRIPAYTHHKSRNQARVRINGRDYYLGKWQSPESLIEYDRLIAEWLANGRVISTQSKLDPKAAVTIVELVAKYIDHLKSTHEDYDKPGSESQRMRYIMRDAA